MGTSSDNFEEGSKIGKKENKLHQLPFKEEVEEEIIVREKKTIT